ncbi:MAG: DISARM system SNF2-like helicase DrmD, partial [Thermoflexales bacterium]|nr:DISARM system SNF2-like helicase DrmD [Thermoflexales bacterium]
APVIHRVTLDCLDDDRLGETLDVIWEREVHTAVHDIIGLPKPEAWDPVARFGAFLHAVEWSTGSVLEGPAIQAPFRGAIEIEEYQLEPVARALVMPRVNLLIADDVGLGKTIEAGLVLQELLVRQRVRRVMVVCPASLQRQWKEEMELRFQLPFEIIDRESIGRLRREYGLHVNPWNSFPRLITSMDFIKREYPLRLFRESLQRGDGSPLYDWDLLIVDEVHNLMPSGRKSYVRDSERTRMLRGLVDHFEHRLFLTATPHNGYTESFTALLEMLDPLRFSRGPTLDHDQVKVVMIRRLKDDLLDELGRRKFALRQVLPLWIDLTPAERRMHELLRQYSEARLARVDWNKALPIRFALTLLTKRLLSSPLAFANSLDVHFKTLGQGAPATPLPQGEEPGVGSDFPLRIGEGVGVGSDQPDEALAERLRQRAEEEWDNDEEKARAEEDALQENTRLFGDLSGQERDWLVELEAAAESLRSQADSKAQALIDWIQEHLNPSGRWNRERLIVFTEYRDTLTFLKTLFEACGWGERIITLMGGMGTTERETVKQIFRASPAENPARILLATDAASEGLNLQEHCRYLIHYEIPWNPNRMEQRNGRIDRHGQRAQEVFCHHFVYRNHADSQFLQTVVDKMQTMRADLGSVGEVIASQVEEAMLGRRELFELPEERRLRVQNEVKADLLTEQRARELAQQLAQARRQWALYPDNLYLVLHEALRTTGHAGLEPVTDGDLAGSAWWLKTLPPAWADCRESIRDDKGRLLMLVFDHSLARDRRDVTLVHLNHPLMRRAMGAFRAQLWAEGFTAGESMHRASYRVLPDYKLDGPIVVAYARVVAVSVLGQKLHEALLPVGGQIRQRDIIPLKDDVLAGLPAEEAEFPALPAQVGSHLRALFPHHERVLLKLLDERQAAEEKRLRALLRERIKDETAGVTRLMRERIREVEKRLGDIQTEMPRQLSLFDPDEAEQYREDAAWLERKLDYLRERLDSEPERIKQRYTLRSVRVFPMGLLYMLPQKLVKG